MHGQILTTLSTQIAQIVNLLSTAQPATHAADSSSPAPRSLSQVFSPNHGRAILPSPSESPATITVMSTKLSESEPILKALDLYDLILYTRSFLDRNTRLGVHTTPPSFASGAIPWKFN